MTDLASEIRGYYDTLTEPISVEELEQRRTEPLRTPTVISTGRRPIATVLAAAFATLALVGGVLVVGSILSGQGTVGDEVPRRGDIYTYSGNEWIGFTFAYPGEHTELQHRSDRPLIDTDRFPFVEYTLLHLEGEEAGRFLDVVWISHQTGAGSVVRDALVVSSLETNPAVDIHCTTGSRAPDPGAPAVALTGTGRAAPLRAWTVDLEELHIEEIDPTLVDCGSAPPNAFPEQTPTPMPEV